MAGGKKHKKPEKANSVRWINFGDSPETGRISVGRDQEGVEVTMSCFTRNTTLTSKFYRGLDRSGGSQDLIHQWYAELNPPLEKKKQARKARDIWLQLKKNAEDDGTSATISLSDVATTSSQKHAMSPDPKKPAEARRRKRPKPNTPEAKVTNAESALGFLPSPFLPPAPSGYNMTGLYGYGQRPIMGPGPNQTYRSSPGQDTGLVLGPGQPLWIGSSYDEQARNFASTTAPPSWSDTRWNSTPFDHFGARQNSNILQHSPGAMHTVDLSKQPLLLHSGGTDDPGSANVNTQARKRKHHHSSEKVKGSINETPARLSRESFSEMKGLIENSSSQLSRSESKAIANVIASALQLEQNPSHETIVAMVDFKRNMGSRYSIFDCL
jgi:hypothetical protein